LARQIKTFTIVPVKVFTIILGMTCTILLFVKCIDHENKNLTQAPKDQTPKDQTPKDRRYEDFAGSKTCATCHPNIYRTHVQTAHYLTSAPAGPQNIKGGLTSGDNRFFYSPQVCIAIEKSNDRFYQVEYDGSAAKEFAPMDITVGSGKRGQTFLYWRKNDLFQLPLTWFTSLSQWTNSPGFSNRVIFNRPATSRCLECHSTYFQAESADSVEPTAFSRTAIQYGVDCEKCHGPAARHVAFHRDNPAEKTGHFIIGAANFSREQKLDLCRLCHGGRLSKTKPSFRFQSGNRLADYFNIDTTQKAAADIDVHGNQYGMMASSKCFRQSEMTCLTCHNPHENETGKLELFSQRCMSCHNQAHGNFCKAAQKIGASITKNCIDCHMPEQPSKSITVMLQGGGLPVSATMRSHFISIYPEETKKFLHKK
jgi:Cytochrome c554 and c-prime